MDLGIQGKGAIVTGGAGGIGQEIIKRLVAEGAQVCLADLDQARCDTVAAQLAAEAGGTVLGKACNVCERESVAELFAFCAERLGPVHLLINSHQVWPKDWFCDITDAAWRSAIDINLTSYFLTCQAMVAAIRAHGGGGSILNISSQAAFRGATTGHAHYAAAKAGVLGLTKSIAREAAGDGIVCNALAPGMARTPATAQALDANESEYTQRIPLGRVAKPGEVADVAVFLVSARAAYMTGTTVDISGGMLMH